MEKNLAEMYIMANANFFPGEKIPLLKAALEQAEESKTLAVQSADPKNPTTMLIVSILIGGFGVDRFMLGQVGLGLLKLLTCGGAGIWTIVDWFLISGRTRELNFSKIMNILAL